MLRSTCLPCSLTLSSEQLYIFYADVPVSAIYDDSVDSSSDGCAPWDEMPVSKSMDANMEEETAEPPKQPKEAVKLSSPSQNSAEMEEEAGKKGYGKAYAAFGGGREGLEACAASKSTLSQWPL